MKKMFFGFVFFLSGLGATGLSLAQDNGLISGVDQPVAVAEVTTFGGSFRSAIHTIVNFTLYFLGLIAVIMIIYSGFLYMTGGGDKAKKIIPYAATGIILVLVSYALVNTLLGAGDSSGIGAQ